MTRDLVPITSLYAIPLALLFLLLSVRVILARRKGRIGFGFGDDIDLQRRIRVHANFAEYTPFALLLMLMAGLNGAPAAGLHIAGILLLIGRVVHAVGVCRLRSGMTLAGSSA